MTLMEGFRHQAEIAAALRLEDWLKGARIPKPGSVIDLEKMRDEWEQVLLSVEDCLLAALFTDDWEDFDELIDSLRPAKVVFVSNGKDSRQEQNLDATFDLAFQRDRK